MFYLGNIELINKKMESGMANAIMSMFILNLFFSCCFSNVEGRMRKWDRHPYSGEPIIVKCDFYLRDGFYLITCYGKENDLTKLSNGWYTINSLCLLKDKPIIYLHNDQNLSFHLENLDFWFPDKFQKN